MKRLVALTLLLVFAVCLSATAEIGTQDNETALYTAVMRVASTVYQTLNDTTSSVGRVGEGKRIEVLFIEPTWAKIRCGTIEGYVRRSVIDNVTALDENNTAPYGVETYRYVAVIGSDAAVQAAPDAGADTLITLYDGAKVSFITVENGWGKLIYHRQYAYINTNCLKALEMTYGLADECALAQTDEPIAAFTSFYKITTNEENIGRMKNIDTACTKLSAITMQPGDSLNFNSDIGPYSIANGYFPAPVLVNGETKLGYGGGTCQVSSTLYNVCLQLPGIKILQRRAHGPSGASYLPHGVDAAVGSSTLNFRFRNDYSFPIRIAASAQDGALYIAIYKAD